MDKLTPVKIPLLNPNEPEALLVSIDVAEGDAVQKDEVIAVIETTKSTGEVHAPEKGCLVGLCFTVGETLNAGDVLAYIADHPAAKDPSLPPWAPAEAKSLQESLPSSLRITAPARALALSEGLDLESLPQGPLVTSQMVREMLSPQVSPPQVGAADSEKRLVIYGAGGHGRSLAALIHKLGIYEIEGFLDDGYKKGEKILGLSVLGGRKDLKKLFNQGIHLAVNGVGGIGNLASRLEVYDLLNEAGFFCPTVVHPSAFLEDSAQLSPGNQVFPFAYLGTEVQVDFGCIINTGAIISHNCILGRYVNLSPGATLAGGVVLDEGALVGMRATVNLNVHVGYRARIGNGATVKTDVPDGGVVPAGTIWPPRQ